MFSYQVRRDGALENDIIVHEMTHGITNRMTGGGTGRCLQTTEAGGMGEGWSDAMAEYASIYMWSMFPYMKSSAGGRSRNLQPSLTTSLANMSSTAPWASEPTPIRPTREQFLS
jgi:extracellular elastinolytic metalloproteinase